MPLFPRGAFFRDFYGPLVTIHIQIAAVRPFKESSKSFPKCGKDFHKKRKSLHILGV